MTVELTALLLDEIRICLADVPDQVIAFVTVLVVKTANCTQFGPLMFNVPNVLPVSAN